MAFSARFVLFYMVLCHCTFSVLGGGVFRLKFVSFKNGAERDWDNNCCDWLCVGKCDHRLTICVDKKEGNNDFSSCSIKRHQTGEFKDKNNVYFDHDMSGVQNPIDWNFNSWPGGIKLKVEVKDDDTGHSSHDLVDRLYQTVTVGAAGSLAAATWTSKTITGTRSSYKTQLAIQYMAYCNQDYFTSDCSVNCKAVNKDGKGHYTCDPRTGSKVCLPGYEDPSNNCLNLADDCIGHSCQNGGICVDRVGHYRCRCNPGFLGDFCEIDITECSSSPCLNGGQCEDGVNEYSCVCTSGYVGSRCEHHICESSPCLNGGTCFVKDDGTIGCECQDHYAGEYCGVYRCKILPCENGGTCENGTCQCLPGYLGNQCDVDFCGSLTVCHNGGTCNRDTLMCDCPIGYIGRYCEFSPNECLSNPCLNDGTCRDHVGSYMCDCLPMYSGAHCETELVPDDTGTSVNPDNEGDTDVTEDPDNIRELTPPPPPPDSDQHSGDVDGKPVVDPKSDDPDVPMPAWIFALIVIALIAFVAVIVVTVLVLR